jgi:hypothetical protein
MGIDFVSGQYGYIQINTWAFPYLPGYHPEIPILARDEVEGQYGSRDDSQANMEMPMSAGPLLASLRMRCTSEKRSI